MKVSKETLEEHHGAILLAASRMFREYGFEGVSVAQIMTSAGLTHGAFYGHFSSKSELAAAACQKAFQDRLPGLSLAANFSAYLDSYLSLKHRDNIARGCAMASLASLVGSQDKDVQKQFNKGVAGYIKEISDFIRLEELARGAQVQIMAASILSEIVGALALSRSVRSVDTKMSTDLLASSRRSLREKYGV